MNFTDREIVSLFFNVARLSRNIPGTKGNDLLPFIGQYRCLLLLENSGLMNQKDSRTRCKSARLLSENCWSNWRKRDSSGARPRKRIGAA